MAKRIAFFVDSMDGGGAERVMLNLANEYIKQGYEVDLVLARKQGDYLSDVDSGIRIIDLATTRFWTYFLPLIRYFKSVKPDVMLSATTILNLLAIMTKFLSRANTHLVVSEHIDIVSFANTGALQRSNILKKLIAFLYPKADQIVAVSNGAAKSLSEFSGVPISKIKAIYNGVIDQHKLDLSHEKLDHPWFGASQVDEPVIVAVGRLQAQKDYPMLLKAFALVCEQRKAKLIILGEGELREELKNLAQDLNISENLSLHGFESNPFKFFASADVFALSSQYEGLPTVLIEALACGCPVVSTNCPSGPEEILEHGKYGTLVSVGNHRDFADALLAVLQLRDESPQMMEKRKRDLMDHGQQFNVDNAFSEYSRVLGLTVNHSENT